MDTRNMPWNILMGYMGIPQPPVPQFNEFQSNPQIALLKSPGGGGSSDACDQGFQRCLDIGNQLHDRGYVNESNQLYEGCRLAGKLCYGNEQAVQAPGVGFLSNRRETLFPPDKAMNGGGYVIHRTGLAPIYVPPSFDSLARFPPKTK